MVVWPLWEILAVDMLDTDTSQLLDVYKANTNTLANLSFPTLAILLVLRAAGIEQKL